MNKCDFCPNSINKNGKIVCPWDECVLTSSKIREILDKLSKIEKRN